MQTATARVLYLLLGSDSCCISLQWHGGGLGILPFGTQVRHTEAQQQKREDAWVAGESQMVVQRRREKEGNLRKEEQKLQMNQPQEEKKGEMKKI